jgi:hypothetical protein
MSFVSNGGKFKLYTVINGLIFPTPTQPRFHLNERQIISLRVEVSLFVLSPEIEDRDEVEVGNWEKHKKTYSE